MIRKSAFFPISHGAITNPLRFGVVCLFILFTFFNVCVSILVFDNHYLLPILGCQEVTYVCFGVSRVPHNCIASLFCYLFGGLLSFHLLFIMMILYPPFLYFDDTKTPHTPCTHHRKTINDERINLRVLRKQIPPSPISPAHLNFRGNTNVSWCE